MMNAEKQPSATEIHSHHGVGHVMPLWILIAVWAGLIFLTYITVAATDVDLGAMSLIVAMAIATVKASLVVLFFMHMLYDRPFNAIVFLSALLFVALFIVLAMMDSGQYQPDLIPGYAPRMNP